MARRETVTRQEPSTAIYSSVVGAQSACIELEPTRKLEPGARQIFGMIMAMRPTNHWGPYDLHLATELADLNARIDCIQEVLAVEGDILTNHLGNPIINPRATHCGNLKRQAVTFVRALGLSAGQRHLGDAPNRKRTHKLQQLQNASRGAEDAPLLA